MALQNQKHLFSIPDHITYLNTAYMSPSFKAVEKAGIDAVLCKSQPFNISSISGPSHASIPGLFSSVDEPIQYDADQFFLFSAIPSIVKTE